MSNIKCSISNDELKNGSPFSSVAEAMEDKIRGLNIIWMPKAIKSNRFLDCARNDKLGPPKVR